MFMPATTDRRAVRTVMQRLWVQECCISLYLLPSSFHSSYIIGLTVYMSLSPTCIVYETLCLFKLAHCGRKQQPGNKKNKKTIKIFVFLKEVSPRLTNDCDAAFFVETVILFFRILWDVESLKGHDFFCKISVFYCHFLLFHSIIVFTA